jgi:hypothetical protein
MTHSMRARPFTGHKGLLSRVPWKRLPLPAAMTTPFNDRSPFFPD